MDNELATRAHRNLVAVSARLGEVPGGEVQRDGGEMLVAACSELPFLNMAMRVGTGGDAAAFVSRAQEFFFARGRGFVVYAHPADPELERAAVAAGLAAVLPRYPEMVCRSPLAVLDGDVRPVETIEDAAAYWRICDEAYPSIGMPAGLFTETFTAASLLDDDGLLACLGHRDDEPVACAMVTMAEGAGMVGWVAATPAARGQGLAAACTVWATNQAFALGGDFAALQSSSMGESLYSRLGYEELYAYRILGAMPA